MMVAAEWTPTDNHMDRIIRLHDMIGDLRAELLTGIAAVNLNLRDLTRQVQIQNGHVAEVKLDIAELQREYAGLEEWRGAHIDWTNQALHKTALSDAIRSEHDRAILTKPQLRRGYLFLLGALGFGAALATGIDQATRHWDHIWNGLR